MLPRLYWIRGLTSVCLVWRGAALHSVCVAVCVFVKLDCISNMYVCHLYPQLIKKAFTLFCKTKVSLKTISDELIHWFVRCAVVIWMHSTCSFALKPSLVPVDALWTKKLLKRQHSPEKSGGKAWKCALFGLNHGSTSCWQTIWKHGSPTERPNDPLHFRPKRHITDGMAHQMTARWKRN